MTKRHYSHIPHFTLSIKIFALLLLGCSFNLNAEISTAVIPPDSVALDLHHYAVELPKTLDFAGEAVPLNLFHVRESFDRELIVNCYYHSATILIIKRANRYFPIIEKILKEEGVPDDFKYLAVIESSLSNVVSPAGAAGFWQFMKGTAKDYKMEVNSDVDERFNLEIATRKACEYLKKGYEEWGSWTLVGATYNAGNARLRKLVEDQGTTDYYDMYMNSETSRYIYRLLAIKAIMENPQKYGFYIRENQLYPEIPTQEIAVDTTIHSLPRFAKKMGISYRILKEFNPWLRAPELPDESRKQYYITLPKKGYTDYDNKLKNRKSEEFFDGYRPK